MPRFQTRDGRVARPLSVTPTHSTWEIHSRGILNPYVGIRKPNGDSTLGDEREDIIPVVASPAEDRVLNAIFGIRRYDLTIDQEQPMIEALREYKGW